MACLLIGLLVRPLSASGAARIKISEIVPKIVKQNDAKIITIKGKGFLDGAEVDLGKGVNILTTEVVSKKQIKLQVIVELDAKVGKRTVVVTNPDGAKVKKKQGLVIKKCKDCEALKPVEGDVIALHNKNSSKYNSDCLNAQCHKGILKETTLTYATKTAHLKMLPFVPGYSSTKGPANENCSYCHSNGVDIISHSAGNLRRNVDVTKCASCHGPSGPGKQFYQK